MYYENCAQIREAVNQYFNRTRQFIPTDSAQAFKARRRVRTRVIRRIHWDLLHSSYREIQVLIWTRLRSLCSAKLLGEILVDLYDAVKRDLHARNLAAAWDRALERAWDRYGWPEEHSCGDPDCEVCWDIEWDIRHGRYQEPQAPTYIEPDERFIYMLSQELDSELGRTK